MSRVTPQGELKIKNKKEIISDIFENGANSRTDLAIKLNTTKTTISKNVKELLEMDILYEIGKGSNTLGKKSTLLDLNQKLFNYIFIDLSGNKFRLYTLNIRGERLYSLEINNLNKYSINSILQDDLNKNKALNNVKYAILSIPGIVQENSLTANNTVYSDLFLSLSIFFKNQNINLTIVNDIELHCEYINSKYNEFSKNFIVIGANYGIGSSIFLENKIYKGENNFAGEIAFVNPKKEKNTIKTLESRCSISGMISMYNEEKNVDIDLDEFLLKVSEKDNIVLNYIKDAIEELSSVIVNMSYSFDIQVFYFCGLFFEIQDDILEKIQNSVNILSARNIVINHFQIEEFSIDSTNLQIKKELLRLVN